MPLSVYIIAPVLLAIYYAVLIASKQRVPRPGAVVVRYDPPADLTPAAARYVWKGCVDQRTVACVFAGLATKGRIVLEHAHGAYKITKTSPPAMAPTLNPDEQSAFEWLFSNFLDKATFNPSRDAGGCISSLTGLLDQRLRGEYQLARNGWSVLGMAVSFGAAMLLALTISADSAPVIKFTATLFLTAFMTSIVIAALFLPAVMDLLRGLGNIGRLLMAVAITGLVLSATIGVFIQFARFAPIEFGLMICLLVPMNIASVPLLRVITPKGVEAQQQIAGFREYLMKVEQDQLDRMATPDSPPPPSATMLSYAIALEVKEAWGDDLVNACFGG